jgi:hypothetical protein
LRTRFAINAAGGKFLRAQEPRLSTALYQHVSSQVARPVLIVALIGCVCAGDVQSAADYSFCSNSQVRRSTGAFPVGIFFARSRSNSYARENVQKLNEERQREESETNTWSKVIRKLSAEVLLINHHSELIASTDRLVERSDTPPPVWRI